MTTPLDYSSLFQLSPFPKLVYDLKTLKLLDVNQSTTDHYGYSREELLSMTINDLCAKEELAHLTEVHENLPTKEGNIHLGRFTQIKKSGEKIRIEINGHHVTFEDLPAFIVICQDVTEKEKYLHDLQESENKLQAAVSIAKLGYWSYDIKTNQLSCSDQVYNIWNRKKEDFKLSYESFIQTIHPEERAFFDHITIHSSTQKLEHNFVHRIILPDGELRWVNELTRLILGDDGKPEAFEGVVRDITEQKNTEQALIKNEKRFRTLVENGADAIVIVGKDGSLSYASPSIKKILGYSEDEVLNLSLYDLIHPDDREAIDAKMVEVLQSPGISVKGETARTRHKDGSWRWLEADLTNMLHDPNINGIVDNFRDVTERKIEEQRLQLLETVITKTKDSVMITTENPDGSGQKIIYTNEAFGKMTGYTADEVIGKNPKFLQGPKTDKNELIKLSSAMNDGRPCEITIINYKKGGEEFWVNFSVSPVANEKGQYTHYIAIERDITEQRNTIQLLNDASELARIGSWEVDLVKNKIYWSPMTFEIHELAQNKTPSLIDGVNYYRSDFREHVAQSVAKCIETGTPFDLEVVIVTEKKNEIWVRVIGKAEMLGGKCVRIYGSFQDIHDRKIAELRLQNVSNNIPGVIFQFKLNTDGTDQIMQVSKGAYKVWGYSPEETMNNSSLIWDAVKAAGDLEHVLKSVERSSATLEPWHCQYRYSSPSGKLLWLEGFGSPQRQADGSTVWDSIVTDITELKKLNEILVQANELARFGTWEVDLVNQKTYWSPITYEIHELTQDKTPSLKDGINYYRSDFREMISETISNCIKTGEPFDYEAILITENKKEVWVRSIGRAEIIEGQCLRIYGGFQDINDRKIAELRLKNISDNIPGVIFQFQLNTDGTTQLLHSSKGSYKIWGISPEETVNDIDLIWDQIRGGGDFELVHGSIMKSAETLEQWHCQYRSKLPSGKVLWLEGFGAPERHADGTTVWDGLITDITEMKKLSEILVQANELARFGSWEIDLSQNHVYLSKVSREIHEIDAERQISQEEVINFYHKDYRQMAQDLISQGVANGTPWDFESIMITAKGREIWLRITGQAEYIDGQCTRMFGSIQDINKRKRAELAVTEVLEEKEKILESIHEAFFALDHQWTVTYWNQKAEKMFNMHREAIVGKNLWSIYPDSVDSDFHEYYKKAIEENIAQHFETHYDEMNIWLEVSAYPSSNGLSVFFKDITDRKKHEIQLLELNEQLEKKSNDLIAINKELEQFAYVASHDLQEPLRMITGFLTQIEKKYNDILDERGKQYIHFAVDGAQRMRRIILDLLDYSRVGNAQGSLEKVDLRKVLEEINLLFSKQIEEKQAKIIYKKLPTIFAHRAPIRQVFQNIIANALHYSKEDTPPEIIITCEDKKTHWEFSISDNGIGIEKDFYSKIFILFQRLHTKEQYTGAGMGLAIAKKIVETYSGKIWVESTVGEGTTFHFTLRKSEN